eukprot:scaffold2679_cov251-Pinguiococcus_pyrenoidosus.AAC.4
MRSRTPCRSFSGASVWLEDACKREAFSRRMGPTRKLLTPATLNSSSSVRDRILTRFISALSCAPTQASLGQASRNRQHNFKLRISVQIIKYISINRALRDSLRRKHFLVLPIHQLHQGVVVFLVCGGSDEATAFRATSFPGDA